MKVLVAETDRKAAALLAKGLRQHGHEVIGAQDASHALSVAREKQPDLVLMNGQLAGGGALVALKRIRSNVYTTNIPVLVLLGRGGARKGELAAAGAQEMLAQNVELDVLVAAMRRHALQPLDFTEAPPDVLRDPARMKALRDTRLLDSAKDETYDRLTRLATRLLDTPTALMSLVDRDRQFFKSQDGLAQPWAGKRQTRLSHSFCQWVVSGNEALVVPDANEHPVLRRNLAVRDMGVVAYAGVPLAGRGGLPIGSFCAIDSKARDWSDDDLATLRDLGDVTQAYAVRDQAQRSRSGSAIHGAARILRRYGNSLDEATRNDLLAIIDEQCEKLVDTKGTA